MLYFLVCIFVLFPHLPYSFYVSYIFHFQLLFASLHICDHAYDLGQLAGVNFCHDVSISFYFILVFPPFSCQYFFSFDANISFLLPSCWRKTYKSGLWPTYPIHLQPFQSISSGKRCCKISI